MNGKVLTLLHPTTGVSQIVNREQVRLADPDIAWDEVHPRPRRKQGAVRAKVGRRPEADAPDDAPDAPDALPVQAPDNANHVLLYPGYA